MIRASRRAVLATGLTGVLAVPTLAGLAHWRWRHGERSVLLHDPALVAGRRFAEAGLAHGGEVRAIEGDRVRLVRGALEDRPALIAGVSRHADALLIEDIAREADYTAVATLHGRADRCSAHHCRPGWQAFGRVAQDAGSNWIEALAAFAAKPGNQLAPAVTSFAGSAGGSGLVTGWLLAAKR